MEQVNEEIVRIEIDFHRIDGVHLREQHHGRRDSDEVEESGRHVCQRLLFETLYEGGLSGARFDDQTIF